MGTALNHMDGAVTCSGSTMCSAHSFATTVFQKTMGQGTVGSGSTAVSVPGSATRTAGFFEWGVPVGFIGMPGTWSVVLKTTGTNANLEWDAVYICLVDGAECIGGETIASATGLAIPLIDVTTFNTNVTGVAVTLANYSDPRAYVFYSFKNNDSKAQSITVAHTGSVNSPFIPDGWMRREEHGGAGLWLPRFDVVAY